MAHDELWSGTDDDFDPADPDFGEPDIGEGLPPNVAFSVDRVFRWGVAWLQEQPQVAVLGGVNVFVLAMLVSGLNFGIAMGVVAAQESGALDQQVGDVLSQGSGMALQLVAWPFQQLVLAGMMVAAALWFQREESSIRALYASVRAAVRALLAGLVAGVVLVVAATVILVPIGGAIALVLAAGGEATEALVVSLVLAIPALLVLVYVSLGVVLAPYAAVLDRLGPVEAVSRSWAAARGTRVTLFVTNFVFGLLNLFSACLCSLPTLVLVPIQVGGFTAAWLRYARHDDLASGWAFFDRHA